MRNRSFLTIAPLVICGVVLLAGASGEKPVPEYMQLMLLEQQYTSQAEHHNSLTLRSNLMWVEHAVRNEEPPDDIIEAYAQLTDASQLRLTKLEEKLAPLRKRVLGPDADLASFYMNDKSRASETKKLLSRIKSSAEARNKPEVEEEKKPAEYGTFQF